MQEEQHKAYQRLQKQGAFLLCSSKFVLVLVSTKLPNLSVSSACRITVTTSKYLNCDCYIPEYYQEPNIRQQQVEYGQEENFSD